MTDQLAVVENKQEHPLVVLRERLDVRKGELRAALPSDINPDQFIRALITSATINPELQACSWPSLWLACMTACRDGLLPDGVEGAIVPYKSRATWIPMYQGQLRRFRRSGKFKWVTANVVREGEEFLHFIDEQGEHFRHVPGDNFAAPIVRIYALATTLDGGVFVNVMSIAEANKIKNMSRAARDDAPWKMWPEEMYKKTALRRLSKVLPNARDLMPTDDEPDDEIEQAAAAQIAPRKPGAAAALDHFAAPPEQPVGLPSDDSDGAAERGADEPSAAQAGDVDRAPAHADDLDEPHRLSIEAYKRGQDAKSKGQTRKAIPPEYRDSKRTREALCWQAGFDGGAMPEFNSEGKELVP
jgi:recombination protein RecT